MNLKFLSIFLLAFLLTECSSPDAALPDKPNILFILADDQSFNTIAALGNEEIRTPTLDELAKNGTVFTSVYNMGGWNGAICIASRTMFNTGRFLWEAESFDHKIDSLANRGELWSQLLDSLGYDTYMTGKWHVKINPAKIFDVVGTKRPGMPGDTPEGYNRPLNENDTTWTPWDTSFGGFWEGGTHWSEVVANETIGFLDSAARAGNPFFMYVAFNAPHDPRQSPRKYVDMYPLENMKTPETFLEEYPYKDVMGCGKWLRDEKLAPFPRTEYAVKVNRQEYYAIISHMDYQVSRILDHLEATGQKENTYIVFTADHGLSCGNHGLLGKQNMYEHSLKPPMIIVGPDIDPGKRKNMDVYLQDIVPTVIELAGGEVPEYIDFSSLKGYLENREDETHYPEVYAAYMDVQRMIRVGEYKLIVYPKGQITRLFNLSEDPLEVNDLATDPAYEEKISELTRKLVQLQSEMSDTLDLQKFGY